MTPSPTDLPVVGELLAWGPQGRVFDWLLLLGPVVILVVAVAGRSPATAAVAGVYLAAFVLYVLYRGIRE